MGTVTGTVTDFTYHDRYLICDECEIDQRVPSRDDLGKEIAKGLPTPLMVLDSHQKLGHNARFHYKALRWPPAMRREPDLKDALLTANVFDEIEYYG